jgi:drug/metabolite transporter (DMT)-like permease
MDNIDRKTDFLGISLVLLSGILYGSMGYLGKYVMMSGFTISNMLFWRFAIASLFFLPIVAFYRHQLTIHYLNERKKDIFILLALGAFLYSGSSGFYFAATTYIGTGLAMVLFFTYPVFVLIFEWYFDNHKITFINLAAILAIITGCALLSEQPDLQIDLYGLLFALISSLSFAAYIFLSKKKINVINATFTSFIVCIGNMLTFLIISLYYDSFIVPINYDVWVHIIALALVATALPILFLVIGLRHITATKASILSVFEPIVSLLIGIMVLNESISIIQTIGVVLIIFSAIIVQLDGQFSRKKYL